MAPVKRQMDVLLTFTYNKCIFFPYWACYNWKWTIEGTFNNYTYCVSKNNCIKLLCNKRLKYLSDIFGTRYFIAVFLQWTIICRKKTQLRLQIRIYIFIMLFDLSCRYLFNTIPYNYHTKYNLNDAPQFCSANYNLFMIPDCTK